MEEDEAVFHLPTEGTTAHLQPQPAQVIPEEGSEGSLPEVLDDEDNEQNVEAKGFAARLSWNVSAEGDVLTGSAEDVWHSRKLFTWSTWEEGQKPSEEMEEENDEDKGEEEEGFEEWRSHNEIKQL